MNWLDAALDQLAERPAIGYAAGGSAGAEPTAIAALALAVHGRLDAARAAASALASMQQPNGEVAVRAGEDSPGWPTSLAIVAWTAAVQKASQPHGPFHQANIDRGVKWLLANRGRPVEHSGDFGHNTELVGWAYAEQTHSWVEPTAFAVLALKAAGQADHPAAREGIAVLLDRQLPGGGLNYGNTYVLGQLIRPHVQPTGIALLALGVPEMSMGRGSAHRSLATSSTSLTSTKSRQATFPATTATSTTNGSPAVAKSLAWLKRSMGPQTTPQSLAWALLGLAAHGATVPQSDEWLAAAANKVNGASAFKLALLALAAKGWPV